MAQEGASIKRKNFLLSLILILNILTIEKPLTRSEIIHVFFLKNGSVEFIRTEDNLHALKGGIR